MNRKKINLIVSYSILWCVYSNANSEEWTWLYKKHFSNVEQKSNAKKKSVFFGQYGIPHFSQLVFSWNAFRGTSGYYSFWIQARDAQSQTWGSWHKMMEWGPNIQRSFYGSTCTKSEYCYVRLEMKKKHTGDAFNVRVMSHEGANLSKIHNFFVCAADFSKFRAESAKVYNHIDSVHVKNVPKKSQLALLHKDNKRMCSPTASSMLSGFLSKRYVDPLNFARHAYDDGLKTYGSWPFNTAHAFELCGGQASFAAMRLASFKALHQKLQKGIPVVVSVRGALQGAPFNYSQGHLLLVVGWDAHKKQVICHDPAFPSNAHILKHYSLYAFLRAWEKSHRLAYLAKNLKGG